MDILSALQAYLGNIIYGGSNQFGSPQPGFQMTPQMQGIAQQNPSLGGGQLNGAMTAGIMPNAPNTAQMSQMANPQQESSTMGSAFGPLAGAGLGYMAGGPQGALRGGLMGGAGAGMAAAGIPPQYAVMAPMILQAFGLGGGSQQGIRSTLPMPGQRI